MEENNFQEALENAAKGMVRIKQPRRLLKMMTRYIDKKFGLNHTSILVSEPGKKTYTFVDSKGTKKIPVKLVKIDSDNPLVKWFTVKQEFQIFPKEYLSYHHLCEVLEDSKLLENNEPLKNSIERIKHAMETYRAALCIPSFYEGDLLAVLMLGKKKSGDDFTKSEIGFFKTLAHDASMAIKNAQYQKDLAERNKELAQKLEEINELRQKEQEIYYQIVFSLAQEVSARDEYTASHLEEVEKLGIMTAEQLGVELKGHKLDAFKAALRLHDIGKVGVPDHILKKKGRLTNEEWAIMKEHVKKGVKILEPLTDFNDVAKIILYHHENFDGSGYPYGISGENIPLESRILAIVDSFHAMISDRCYRKAMSVEEAIEELKRCSGTQFDPKVVEAFLRAFHKEMKPGMSPE